MKTEYPISLITAAMVDYSDGNVHDISHFMRVYCYAKTIGEIEGLSEKEQAIVEIAALVHDIACPLCRIKYGDTSGKHQEKESEPLVRELLSLFQLPEDMTERIVYIVCHHHTYTNVDGRDYRIILEADYIVNAEENSWPKEMIAQAKERIFETTAGRHLLCSVFFPELLEDEMSVKDSAEMAADEEAAHVDEQSYRRRRRRMLSQGVIAAATAAGVTVGAVPIPFSDAVILTPTESAEVNAIARIYGIKNDSTGKLLISCIVDNGTAGLAARALISGLKAIPGVNVAASVLNAVIAGTIIAAIGEASVYIFEKISEGEKTAADTEWASSVLDERMSPELVKKIKPLLEGADAILDPEAIVKIVSSFVSAKKGGRNKNGDT